MTTYNLTPPTHDTRGRESSPGSNYGSDITTYVKSETGDDSYTFIKFDLSSIPGGATVTSVTLKLYCSATDGGGGVEPSDIYRCDASWDESTLTWSNMPGAIGSALWDGDMSIATGWHNYTLDLTEFANMQGTNNGMRFKQDRSAGAERYCAFRTSEHATPGERPILTVVVSDFTPKSVFIMSLAGLAIPAALGQILVPTAEQIARLT